MHEAKLSGAILCEANLRGTNFRRADLSHADLRWALLWRNILSEATLTGARVYGTAVWDVGIDETTNESDLVITDDQQLQVTVDNLEVAQFVYLVLNNKKIRDVINTVAKKAVLILGRFTKKRKAVLDEVANCLRTIKKVLGGR